MHLTQPAVKRGWQEMPSFRLETRFPLGLFKAWSWIFPDVRCLVYPAPARNAPPLPKTGRGDSGLARKGYSLEMETPREEACELNWDDLGGADVETRLSILTAWVISADRKQVVYSMNIPGNKVAVGSGDDHRARCLELLALHQL